MELKWQLLLCALLIRLVFIAYGYMQDEYMTVKYTDIDYDVYTDAAREISFGNSPFARTTYRYTPVLALVLLPNIYVHPVFGKLLFVLCDILIGYFITLILQLRGYKNKQIALYTSVWLFHPFSINISTRGNADAIVALLVVVVVFLLMKKQLVLAALVYGAAVHFKIYPIVYALAMLVFLNPNYRGLDANDSEGSKNSIWRKVALLFSRDRIVFSLVSGGVFLLLGALFYAIYGYEFVYETYLYHFTRTDNRHNFSVYFYDLYLRYSSTSGVIIGVLSFLPQLVSLIVISIKLGEDLPFCLFALTMTFVLFNKVCTAQYFLWYTVFFPLILPYTCIQLKWDGISLISSWLLGELHWLYWAYRLEMKGENTFLMIWIASLVFFIVNVYILTKLIQAHKYSPLFQHGQITTIHTPINNGDKRKVL